MSNPEQSWLEPAREQDVLTRLRCIHGCIEQGMSVPDYDARWMAHVMRGLIAERIAARSAMREMLPPVGNVTGWRAEEISTEPPAA